MRKARIYQQGTRATQSGKARSNLWILEAEPSEGKRPDPLMGWAGSGDTDTQVVLSFPSLDAARAYAQRHGLEAEVVPTTPKRLILQSYAENFR
ncbi:ETC complex I subunit [Sandaracinobacter sp. RS1-74]|uniref:ETC complex I subunit n=1 Tax=Sandaracinobacteroides sayramensis TaxID=2913411 RepID=UPI001EDAEAED|nr:ETC complex I subunit [Sandaracinobacteroides sayramensis]MCG2840271.1 ETC complex I subunit [Sandaracinobacteroides sayramensis]